MQELDREAMGKRIRQIRLGAGLRQWELARLLGTTQSAVHKYEHGVVPEPRRLVELSRIGGTSIEWVLTGQHWESGSPAQPRLSPDLLDTACILREIGDDGRATIDEALRIVREAVRVLRDGATDPPPPTGCELDGGGTDGSLREHSAETLRLLESASRIHRAVLSRIAQETEKRLDRAQPLQDDGNRERRGGASSRRAIRR